MQDSQESAVATPSERTRPAAASEIAGAAAVGRRRLIKAGAAAVPVAATLVSRPAFAWHGKTPSAWGSEVLNPNTSLKAVHQEFADETWLISNWTGNSSRANLGNTWDTLIAKYPSLKTQMKASLRYSSNWYAYITCKQLFNAVGSVLVAPSGMSRTSTDSVVNFLNSQSGSFQAFLLVAQLNYLLLANGATPGLKNVLTTAQLQQMASGSFKPNTSGQDTWDQTKIVRYLQENWVVYG